MTDATDNAPAARVPIPIVCEVDSTHNIEIFLCNACRKYLCGTCFDRHDCEPDHG